MSGTTNTFLPVHRHFVLCAAAGAFLLAAWASLARIDIVVSAQGKLAPSSFVRISQSPEDGMVRHLKVHDGQRVEKGATLLELDPLYAKEDVLSAEAQRARLLLVLERIDAELEDRPFAPNDGPSELRAATLADYTFRRQTLNAALSEAVAAENRAMSERKTAQERLSQAEQTLPLVSKQARQQSELRAQGFVSDAVATDKDKELVVARQDLAAQQSAVAAADAAVSQAKSAHARVLADYRRQLAAERAQTLSELATYDADVSKRSHRLDLLSLKAPVAGTVNGLAGLSAGHVVKAGQTLLTVVPEGDTLRFEGWLRNEDAAYVGLGMPVKVKLAAYPFQKYGWVEGEVTWLGVDSETPDSMRNAQGEPLFYRLRVNLKAQRLLRDGQSYAAKPGMQAVADVQIGTRTLLEYLTSPMRKTLLEAAREK